jgi:hypothetical protein
MGYYEKVCDSNELQFNNYIVMNLLLAFCFTFTK